MAEIPSDHEQLQSPAEADDASAARAWLLLPATLFALIAGLIGFDVVDDWSAGAGFLHVGLESFVLVLASIGTVLVALQLRQARVRERALGSALSRATRSAAKYRAEAEAHLRGLSEAIDHQFTTWGLSAAEREIGFLLLKGLALKDIAVARGTSERTVRAQALAIYKKAEVAGRAELSAFFLEDLLAPRGA